MIKKSSTGGGLRPPQTPLRFLRGQAPSNSPILFKNKSTVAISRVVWRQFRVQISYRCRKTEDLVFRKNTHFGGDDGGDDGDGERISKSDPAPFPSRPGMEYRVRLPLTPIYIYIYTHILEEGSPAWRSVMSNTSRLKNTCS